MKLGSPAHQADVLPLIYRQGWQLWIGKSLYILGGGGGAWEG